MLFRMEYRKQIYSNYHSTHVNAQAGNKNELLQQQAAYYFKELVPFLPLNKDGSLLEIGCGYGSFIQAAKKAGYSQLEGVDLSVEQVAVARELGINEVRQEDLFTALEGDDIRDIIVGIDIIEHFSKDEVMELLAACKRHLKPGGSVLFRTPNMDAPLSSVYAHADFSHELFLNKSSALQLFRAAGFDQVEVFPSLIYNQSAAKELARKMLWSWILFKKKLMLFASGRTWDQVVFSPNLIIRAKKA